MGPGSARQPSARGRPSQPVPGVGTLRKVRGRWSLEANLASYLMMECVLVVLAIAVAIWRRQGLIP